MHTIKLLFFYVLHKIKIHVIIETEEGVYVAGKTNYKNEWQNKNCERISLVVKKGEKSIIKSHANKYDNGSLNGFINRAIRETIKNDNNNKKE